MGKKEEGRVDDLRIRYPRGAETAPSHVGDAPGPKAFGARTQSSRAGVALGQYVWCRCRASPQACNRASRVPVGASRRAINFGAQRSTSRCAVLCTNERGA